MAASRRTLLQETDEAAGLAFAAPAPPPSRGVFRRLARRLPVLLGAAVLVLPWLYLGWNTTIGELAPSLRFRTKQTIAGVFQEANAQANLANILNYRLQRQISEAVGRLSPVYATAIKAKAQLYFRGFGASPNPEVVIGTDGELYQPAYLKEYCGRDTARLAAQAPVWAARIRDMQNFFTGRGQAFVYVITPSKAALYPEYLPPTYSCPATQDARTRKLAVWSDALTRAGVRFVDTAGIVAAAKQEGAADLYPKGGIHWNGIGAALAAQVFIASVNAMDGPVRLAPFTWDVRMSHRPLGSDRDLLDILNVPWPDDHYEVPELTYHSKAGPECRPVRIVQIGGSFLFRLNETLSEIACPPVIDLWFYWKLRQYHYPPPEGEKRQLDPAVRRSTLDAAELVVFEENEAALPMSEQGTLLLRDVVDAHE